MLIAADNVEKSTLTIREPDVVPATSYIPTQSIINIFSWLGSSLYSLATLPSKVVYPQVEEYDHEQVLSTIQKLNNHLTFLDKKIDKMNSNTNRFGEKAKTLYKMKNVKGAMHQIRLKKMYDREIEKLESLKFNIETQILHMDSVEIMMVTVDTIKDTSEYYQSVNSNINITKLENTIDEMVEHRDSSTDIQSILSDINTFNEQSYDDDDLLKELQEMADSEEDNAEKPDEAVHEGKGGGADGGCTGGESGGGGDGALTRRVVTSGAVMSINSPTPIARAISAVESCCNCIRSASCCVVSMVTNTRTLAAVVLAAT